MKKINEVFQKQNRSIKVIQFGGGVFLRGFFDWMLQILNEKGLFEGSAAVVKPTASPGNVSAFEAQDYLYTNLISGLEGEERQIVDVIDHVVNPYQEFEAFLALAKLPQARFIVSNTTEAGLAFCPSDSAADRPSSSFPAKLTQLLYHRFSLGLQGFWILPCELIEQNGTVLQELVLRYAQQWGLGNAFIQWVKKENQFCDTLVDRIVSGFPADAVLSYQDSFCNMAEPYHFWAISGGEDLFSELPLDRAGLNVLLTKDLTPYRERKVRLLNGAHTAMVCYGLQLGLKTVEDCMRHKEVRSFISNYIEKEAMETICLPRQECEMFWGQVQKRFLNPYLHHSLEAISSYSVSKFRVRILPVILDLERRGKRADNGMIAWRHLIKWYQTGTPVDDCQMIERMKQGSIKTILADSSLWGADYSRFAKEMEQ